VLRDTAAAAFLVAVPPIILTLLTLLTLPTLLASPAEGPPAMAPGALGAMGIAVMIAGTVLAAWSVRTCVKWGYRDGAAGEEQPSHLVVQGPYGGVRNPFHLGVGLVLAGELLLAPSWPLAGYLGAVALACHFAVVRRDEPRLARRFGRAYAAYVRAIPRWIPRLATRRTRLAIRETIVHA
jgi:protein-S-isoprenylcysteine O-methyltransferase Ste14